MSSSVNSVRADSSSIEERVSNSQTSKSFSRRHATKFFLFVVSANERAAIANPEASITGPFEPPLNRVSWSHASSPGGVPSSCHCSRPSHHAIRSALRSGVGSTGFFFALGFPQKRPSFSSSPAYVWSKRLAHKRRKRPT